ncbi:transglutaminaseTgpA domain-containing protein [Petropleomorpha daqingensis]|uniref:Transglutaminase-like putative cysteine protease n=1 Tax=Petropleomorpha daqingensis TaxID=2026353 RepID=A0A853CIE8_9ACTN|nr:transglutaminase-like putative cysteine protease [Petropleomorpha daqingensis]
MNREDIGSAVAAAVATLLGAFALKPVYATGAWFPPVLATVVVVLAGGLLLRAAGPALWTRFAGDRPVPGKLGGLAVPLVPIGQMVLVGCLLTALYAPRDAFLGVIPTPTSIRALGAVLSDGSAEMREQATPALPLHGLLALTVVLVGLVAIAIDLVAVAGRQPALAGLGLLIFYCVPVATITGGIGLTAIAAPAAGLGLLLWADQNRRLARRNRSGRRTLLGTGTLLAVRTGVFALAAGLVIGALVPTLTEGSLTTGLGGGEGGGSSTGTSLDPVAALQGQLTLPDPIDLLRVDASVDDPGYLRAVSLDRYDANKGWSLSNLDGERSIADRGSLAPLPSDEQSRRVTESITVLGHDDRFMPVPNSPLTVAVHDGDSRNWRFDETTGTVFGRNVTTAGLSYEVTASEPEPSTALLEASPALPQTNPVQNQYTQLPLLNPSVASLVRDLVADARTPYDKVRAIHGFLTNRANGFVYSLSTAPGTSGDDLTDFLRLRRGYCEQYAGAMAVMVRAAGVPARVALGYTPGKEASDGTRLITSDDAHAWVEVYFADLGWVPFDPTPISADRAVQLPWAPRADAPQNNEPLPTAAAPTGPTQAGPTKQLDPDNTFRPLNLPQSSTAAWLRPTLLFGGGTLVLLAVIATPALIRRLQRRRRLSDGAPAALWDELAATAVDLGIPVHPAWTPRQTARQLAGVVNRTDGASAGRAVRRPDTDPAAVDALRRLALAEEASSYARPGTVSADPELVAALRAARRGLVRATPPRTRALAVLWPSSLLTGAGRRWGDALGRRATGLTRRRPRTV